MIPADCLEPNHARRAFIRGSDARIVMGNDEAALIRLWQEAWPVFFSYQCRFNGSVTVPSWTKRSSDKSSGSTSSRF